MVYPVSPLEY